jgi:hypothetical protein
MTTARLIITCGIPRKQLAAALNCSTNLLSMVVHGKARLSMAKAMLLANATCTKIAVGKQEWKFTK